MMEYAEVKDGNLDGLAVSTRNLRYMRHRFSTELSPVFAVSHNVGDINAEDVDTPGSWPRELCRDGQQIMHEALRMCRSWKQYRETILNQSLLVRRAGGHHTVVALNGIDNSLSTAYAAIFTFAGGSHPYLSYGWGRALPGQYTRFATRFGELLWDPGLQQASPEQTRVRVISESPLLWQPYLFSRTKVDGKRQTVLHLITPPVHDEIAGQQPVAAPAWQRNVEIAIPGTAETAELWLLSAEPHVRTAKLTGHKRDKDWIFTVPEHRLWSVLVW